MMVSPRKTAHSESWHAVIVVDVDLESRSDMFWKINITSVHRRRSQSNAPDFCPLQSLLLLLQQQALSVTRGMRLFTPEMWLFYDICVLAMIIL